MLSAFQDTLPFSLSAYQQAALAEMERPGVSVIVVAPTGSGKSVVADAAIWQALYAGRTVAYTSPLRALANQRFKQLVAQWGSRVGLLTGDTAIRPGAPARVMTTEVYRTISLMDGLQIRREAGGAELAAEAQPTTGQVPAWAIFDEAHYLADPERGVAWEEAILATPPETRILCLSATIGAPERLAGWLRWLGREVALVEARERPVPLRHYLYAREDLQLVMDEHGTRAGTFPFAGGWALAQRRGNPMRGGAGPMRRRRLEPLSGLPAVPPDDWLRDQALEALGLLRERGLTPTIAFLTSRRECERLADAARRAFPDDARGLAFHHAGMAPRERQRVEAQLRAGDLWLVCGTTTLAAGVDVPARSVLLTAFGRYDGREFVLFTPSEYRQLTGRAGRLGKDDAGAAVLLPSPWHGFEEAFRKLTQPLPPLGSAFRPTYATALAWWSAGPPDQGIEARQERLAGALARTFAAYLRRTKGGHPPPPFVEPDGPSRLQARALGRLLALDGLAQPEGEITQRGRFILQIGGGPEGRLLLRLLEDGAFDALGVDERATLLATVAEGEPDLPQGSNEDPLWQRYVEAHRRQVIQEREAGALLTGPLAPLRRPPSDRQDGASTIPAWRRGQAASDLLERAVRANQRSGLALPFTAWAREVLAQLQG